MPENDSRATAAVALLPAGWFIGCAVGMVGGAVEAAVSPLAETWRIPWIVGADGLAGGVFGLLAAIALLPARPLSRWGAPASGGILLGVTVFPGLLLPLGLLVNRVLLAGTHFLSLASLAADAFAALVAIALSLCLGRSVSRTLARRPRPLPGLAAALVSAALLAVLHELPVRAGQSGETAPSDLPPIVLVSIDTLRLDGLSTGGDPRPTSPEIDRLCREGLFFPDATCVSPGSAASHAALLTSRYPVSNGVWANFTVMDSSVTTLAEVLRDRGYRTGGFVTNTFLGRRFGFAQGFECYVESGVVEALGHPGRAAFRRSLVLTQVFDRVRSRFSPGHDPSFETALAWLGEDETPPFLFLQIMDVHSPYVPPAPWGARFGARREGDGKGPVNRFGWRPSEEAYAAEIGFADAKIGRLRRTLEELGILEDAVILLTSDHGENLLDHEPHFSHGRTLFDSTLRVLASIRAPGHGVRPAIDGRTFENVDVLPTMADVLEESPHPHWEGQSARRPSPGARWAVSQLKHDFAMRTPSRKIIFPDEGARLRFRLESDPGEQAPTAPFPDEDALQDSLDAWIRSHATDLYRKGPRAVTPDEMSPETVEKLRTLGYIH